MSIAEVKKICVVTANRAEYGLLKNLIHGIEGNQQLALCLVVTGSHLSKSFGYTVSEIEEDGFPIAERIPILMESDAPDAVGKTMGLAMIAFSDMFQRQKPNFLVVLGDRYELIPICSSAMVAGIPIAHISGGEVTEGALDDTVRHCVTKMSTLHFPGCEVYRKRIIQLGEEPDRVFNYGDIGIETLLKHDFLSLEEMEQSMGISLQKPYVCMTYHPVTTEHGEMGHQLAEVLAALEEFPELLFIMTKANADAGGRYINEQLEAFTESHSNCHLYASLGIRRYTSLMKHCEFVLGNSSSGIIEAPILGVPTVNIGNRQKGRLMADSIICCDTVRKDIVAAMRKALSTKFREMARHIESPYGKGDTSKRILDEIERYLDQKDVHGPKKFFDVDFSYG